MKTTTRRFWTATLAAGFLAASGVALGATYDPNLDSPHFRDGAADSRGTDRDTRTGSGLSEIEMLR